MKRCEVCPRPAMKSPHHIMTRGAHRSSAEIPENLIDLCGDHHRFGPDAVHNIGRWSFAEKFGLTERFKLAEKAVREHQVQGLAC